MRAGILGATIDSKVGGESRREAGVSSTSPHRIVVRPKFSTFMITSEEVASDGACSHIREAWISPGLGRRNKSIMKAASTTKSHTNRPAIMRGARQAGTTQSNPNNIITRNRGPNPNGNLPNCFRRAVASGGARDRGSFMTRNSFQYSLGYFDRPDNLANDLISGQSFKIGFRFEQNSMA